MLRLERRRNHRPTMSVMAREPTMAVQSRRVKGMLFLSPEPVSQVDTVVLLSGARLHQLCNAEEAVKPRIKAQNPLDAMLFHDREMKRVTGRQPPIFRSVVEVLV